MKYQSSSKGDVEISEMATPHICNALRKINAQFVGQSASDDGSDELVTVRDTMVAELLARGCTWDVKMQNWTFPEAKP